MTIKYMRTTSYRGEMIYSVNGEYITVRPVDGGFTDAHGGTILTTPEAVCESYAIKQIPSLINTPKCHYCGQPVSVNAKPNMLNVYQCNECR